MGHIKAILFDLDGTLRIPTPEPVAAFITFVDAQGIALPATARRDIQRWAHRYWADIERVEGDRARGDDDDFWNHYSSLLLRQVGIRQNLVELSNQVRLFFQTMYAPHEGVVHGGRDTLAALRARGLRLGLVSNRFGDVTETLAALSLTDYFEVALAAGDVGYWKPDPAVFRPALAALEGVAPADCVYVGDNYYADVCGARAAGLQPILFDPDNLYAAYDCRRIRRFPDLLTEL